MLSLKIFNTQFCKINKIGDICELFDIFKLTSLVQAPNNIIISLLFYPVSELITCYGLIAYQCCTHVSLEKKNQF